MVPPMNLEPRGRRLARAVSLGAHGAGVARRVGHAVVRLAASEQASRGGARCLGVRVSCAVVGVGVFAGARVMSPVLAAAPVAGIAVFPASLNLPSQIVGTTTPASLVYITNTGDEALTLTSISPIGDFSDVTSCGATLAAGGNCAVAVSFTPDARARRPVGSRFVDSASGSPHNVALAGTGLAPLGRRADAIWGLRAVGRPAQSGTLTHSSPVTVTVP